MANAKTVLIKRTTTWEVPSEFMDTVDELEANPGIDDDDDEDELDDEDDDDMDD